MKLELLIADLLIILLAGLLGGLVCRWLKLPLMLGYLVMGVVIGPAVLGWIVQEPDSHEIEHLAEAGVFLLLFTIGLEFSLHELGKLGRYSLVGGGVQMLLVAVPVGLVLWLRGTSPPATLLLCAAAAFSSTVVVFRILSELGQTATPHGQRSVAVLLFQDAALVPLLLAVPLLTGGQPITLARVAELGLLSIIFVVGVIALRYVVAQWATPILARLRSPELVLLFALVMLSMVTYATYRMKLPAALGAFAAGLVFNGNRLTAQVDALVLPFRQTFAAIFFVSLGLLLQPGIFAAAAGSILLTTLALLLVKSIAAAVALRLTGLSWKVAAGMGLGLAHLGEFSLVLALKGLDARIISPADYQQLLCVALLTLILTPFLLRWGLRWIEPEPAHEAVDATAPHRKSLSPQTSLVIGAGMIGRQVTSQLETFGSDVCLVDLSPVNLHPFALQGFHTIAGDARDTAVLRRAGARDAQLVVIAVPDDAVAESVLRSLRDINEQVPAIVRCRYHAKEHSLRAAGASHVISEESQAAGAILRLLMKLNKA